MPALKLLVVGDNLTKGGWGEHAWETSLCHHEQLVARPGPVPVAGVDAWWVSDGYGLHAKGLIPCAVHPFVATIRTPRELFPSSQCEVAPVSPARLSRSPVFSFLCGTLHSRW